MTHAMTFTAVSAKDDQEGVFIRCRVENSWGEDRGHKGYLCRRIRGSLSTPTKWWWTRSMSLTLTPSVSSRVKVSDKEIIEKEQKAF